MILNKAILRALLPDSKKVASLIQSSPYYFTIEVLSELDPPENVLILGFIKVKNEMLISGFISSAENLKNEDYVVEAICLTIKSLTHQERESKNDTAL